MGTATEVELALQAEIQQLRARIGEYEHERAPNPDEESRKRLDLALEAAELGTWEVDLETGFVTASARTREMLGFDSPQSRIEDWAARTHPDDRERVIGQIGRSVAERSRYDTEYRVIPNPGSVRWVSAKAVPILDSAGHATRLVGVAQDITVRKNAEDQEKRLLAALQEEKDRLSAVIASIGDEVWLADAEGRFALANPSALRAFNLAPDSDIGVEELAASLEVFRPDGTPRPIEDAPPLRALRGESVRGEEEIIRAPGTGQLRYREVSSEPVKDDAGNTIGSVSVVRDITDRKRAEGELHNQQEWLRVTLNSIGDAVLATDADAKITFLNPVAARLTGWTEEEALGRTAQDVVRTINEGTREPAEDIVLRVLRDHQVISMANHTALVTRDGREIPIEDSAAPIRDAAGNVAGVVIVFHDVSAKRRAEAAVACAHAEALNERNRLAALMEALPIGVALLDAEGGLISLNRGFEHVWAGPRPPTRSIREYAAYKAWWAATGELVQPEEWASARAVRNGDTVVNQDIEIQRFDGTRAFVLNSAAPIRNAEGGIVGSAVAIMDITARKQSEDSAKNALEQLRMALEAAQMGAWDYHFDTGAVFWDERCAQMFGIAGGEINDAEAIAHIHPDDQAPVRQALARAISGLDDGKYDVEFRVGWPDGSEHWITSHGRVYFTEGDERVAVRFIGVNLDITGIKVSERDLREAQKLESLGLLAGGVAHDFNNLLVGVIGNASLAEEMLPPDNPACELIQRVIKTGEQAAHLTRQMLAYSGKGKFFVERLNLSELIREMSGLVRPSVSKKIAVHLDLGEDLPAIEADRGQVQQVFMNLALNAAEAIGSHDGVITIRSGVQQLDDRYRQLHPEAAKLLPGEYVVLQVRDDGCGMDAATRARIFEPFFSTKFTGRGLGLAAVAGIVRSHNGAITVSSAPGEGSCFTVLFPAAARAAERCTATRRADALHGAGVILVVDDEQVVRDVAKRSLERQGYTVLLADSGLAAIDILRRLPADIELVVLDMSMPQMSGEEALPEIRRIRPRVKVIISSGYSEAETLTMFKGQQLSGFIQKPYTSKGLAEKVKQALR